MRLTQRQALAIDIDIEDLRTGDELLRELKQCQQYLEPEPASPSTSHESSSIPSGKSSRSSTA